MKCFTRFDLKCVTNIYPNTGSKIYGKHHPNLGEDPSVWNYITQLMIRFDIDFLWFQYRAEILPRKYVYECYIGNHNIYIYTHVACFILSSRFVLL